jgi:hypothetical protein
MANPTATAVKQKAGITYGVDQNGARDIRERYQVVLSRPLAAGEVITSFTGVPAIGSAHPQRPGYYAEKYEITQPTDAAKSTLDITVIYSPTSYVTETIPGDEPQEVESNVVEWGWDDSTTDRELQTDVVNGKAVINSAGDPFDSSPQVSAPAPTFTKVIKFKSRQSFFEFNCCVNDAQITISDENFPAGSLLCTVAERRNIGDDIWPYTYTVRLRYRSYTVKIAKGPAVDIGWDVSVTDTGMRELDTNGQLKLIEVPSRETGELSQVTAPELLDGNGHAVVRVSGSQTPVEPYNFRFAAYPRATLPEWFYSEPPIGTPPST